jgi:hypothetical protein
MTSDKNVILDLRETADIRGFHLLAALAIAAPFLTKVKLHYIGGEAEEEMLAIQSWQFDSGCKLSRWSGEALPFGLQFDLYAIIAESIVTDSLFEKAREVSRQTIVGLTFPVFGLRFGPVVVPANDVSSFALDMRGLLTIDSER